MEHRRPNIVICNTTETKCQIIDVVTPAEDNIAAKQIEKKSNCFDPKTEIDKLVKTPKKNINITPVVLRILGHILLKFKEYIK